MTVPCALKIHSLGKPLPFYDETNYYTTVFDISWATTECFNIISNYKYWSMPTKENNLKLNG